MNLPPDHPAAELRDPYQERQRWLERANGPSETGNQHAVPCPTPRCRATFKGLDDYIERGDSLKCHACGRTSVVTAIDRLAMIEVTLA